MGKINKLKEMQVTGQEISRLSDKEALIVIKRVEGETLTNVGKYFGVTRERIRQIEYKIIDKISNIRENPEKYFQDMQSKKKQEFVFTLSGNTTPTELSNKGYLSARCANALMVNGIRNVNQLIIMSWKELFSIDGLGVTAIEEVRQFLGKNFFLEPFYFYKDSSPEEYLNFLLGKEIKNKYR